MEIIYTYLATDKDTQGTSLPQSCVNHTLYPSTGICLSAE